MILASMIELNEDALICDFAETYHIYDYRSLPLRVAATLSAGLRENSRIKLLAANSVVSQDTLLLAMIADRIELFRYSFSDKNNERPVLLTDKLLGEDKSKQTVGFDSPEELNAWLAKIRGE